MQAESGIICPEATYSGQRRGGVSREKLLCKKVTERSAVKYAIKVLHEIS